MSSIITLVDAQGIKKPKRIEYDGLLSDWLIANKLDEIPTLVFAGGMRKEFLIADSDSEPSRGEHARLNMHHENVFIVSNPLGADPYSILIRVVISVAISLVVSALTPSPQLPEGTRQARQSPNNSVGPQTNISRPNDRVPDVFGEDRCTPDLITPGVFEFKDHVKFIEQDFCVSRGFGLIEDVRSGETKGSDIVGFELTAYDPTQSPTELLNGRESNEVKALTLNPPNDAGVQLNTEYYTHYNASELEGYVLSPYNVWGSFNIGSSASLNEVYYADDKNLDGSYFVNSKISLEEDLSSKNYSVDDTLDQLSISGDFSAFSSLERVFLDITSSTGNLPQLKGIFTLVSASASLLIVEYVSTTSYSGSINGGKVSFYSLGLNEPLDVNGNWSSLSYMKVLQSVGGAVYDPRVFGADDAKKRGPYVVPGDNNEQVWVDVQFPRGLVRDGDKSYSVSVNWFFEEIDSNDNPTGPSFNYGKTFSDNEVDPRFYTRKVDSTTPGFVAGKRYRVTSERTSNTNSGDNTLLDQCQWTRLVGIENIAKTDTTGTTRIKVKTQATEQTSSLQQSQINLRWIKKCAYWNGSQVIGDLDTGVGLVASRKFADNFLTYSLDKQLGARNVSNIDVITLYEIQAELDAEFNGEKGEFGFTFSDANTPALEEMRQIANACRCFIYMEGSIVSFVRDQEQLLPTTMFNRRNKVPFRERKSQRTNKPLDFDGVQYTYKDRVKDEQKTILIPDDLPITDPNYGAPTPQKYKVITGTGVRNRSQAWDRAQYEYNKIIYQREQVETTVTEEGVLLNLNDRIEHEDGTRINDSHSHGEVVGFSGLIVDTSEMCFFEPLKTYSVIFRNENGTITQAIPVTQRSDTAFGFVLDSQQTLLLRGDNGYQFGSLYDFAANDDKPKSYLVQSINPDDTGNVTLELINYDARYYQADNQIPPAEQ